MKTGPRVIFLGLLLGSLTLVNAENSTPAKPGDLRAVGKVDFPITCAPAVRPEFIRGVALLHSFFYEEARRIFTAVAEQDPDCAMAQWGIAMTWWHPIWTPPTPEEMKAGQTAIAKAMSLKAGTDRERQFITALNAYYNTADGPATEAVGQSCHGPVGSRDRVVAYEKEMRQLALAYPDDFEAQTFYALAVLAVGYATPTDTTLAHQLQAATILEKLWKKNPQHPGVTHYLIHSYDYPSLAQRGLAPAKAYGAIAPWVPHALHMPSHIFTRLGMWEESIAANLAAVDAARAYAVARGRTATEAEELHPLDYLVYSYLQEARDGEAKKIVDFVATVHETNPALEFSAAYGLAAVPARYALERSAWAEAAALRVPELPHWSVFPFMEALFEYAHALGRAHLGDLVGARAALARMAQLRDATKAPKFDYFKRHLDLQMQAASAWIAFGEGRKEEAVELLRKTADAEDLLGKHPVSPGALVPVREQLGDLLLQLDRPKEAQQTFASALKIYPGRLQGLSGAAQAAERSGDRQSASGYYAKLVEQTAQGDASRPEVIQARAYRSAEDPAAHSGKAVSDRE